MTISSETRKAGPFLGTGAVSEYPFDFTVFSAADLLVVMADENGAESTLVLDSDYTVTLNGDQDSNPGGTVELTVPLPVDNLLVVTSEVEALQPTDLTNQGGFYPSVVNAALDRLTILVQQLKEQVSRSLKVSITSEDDATPDALLDQLNAVLVSAGEIEDLAEGHASDASASAVAAAASAVAAAAFDPNSMSTLTLNTGAMIRRADMRFTVPTNEGIFQGSFTNGGTHVGAKPNGTSVAASFFAKNGTSSENVSVGINATEAYLQITKDAAVFGDAYLPLKFNVGNAERLRIENDGVVKLLGTNAMIGATAYPANVTTGLYVLNGVSATGYRSPAGTAGAFANFWWNLHWNGSAMALWVGTTNVGNLTITSDYRIKRDVQDMAGGALDRVGRLRPVVYRHTDAPDLSFTAADDAQREGFIAHELADVVPSAVVGEKDAPDQIQSLRLDPLVALLVKAVQEQQAQINGLTQRLKELP